VKLTAVKFFHHRRPAWQAPLAGAVLLSLYAVRAAYSLNRPVTGEWLAGSALLGASIGLLVALCDAPNTRGTTVGRFLALISPATALMPIFGLPFNAAAWWSNRRHPGGLRTLSRLTFAASVVWSLATAALLLFYQ
jgi:hypothetical protein